MDPASDQAPADHQPGEQEEEYMTPPGGQMQFSDEEIQNLKEIFDLFDKDRKGWIIISDLEAIMQSLQRDPQEAKDLLMSIRHEAMQNPDDNVTPVEIESD